MDRMIELSGLKQRTAIEPAVAARRRGWRRMSEASLPKRIRRTPRTAFCVEQIGPLISSNLF
jgi:hypothetical protein